MSDLIAHGIDGYGAEYKRSPNDFHFRRLEQDNCVCSICHGTGAKIEFEYVTRNYESARRKGKICENLQAHGHSFWICPACIKNLVIKSNGLVDVLVNERIKQNEDLISRQALLEKYDRLHVGEPGRARKMIEDAPSAQPEKRTEERTETHACDLISRQEAIDEIGEWIKAFLENGHKESAADARLIQDGIIQLPSAQPVDKDINVPTNDYISRQAAIDAVFSEPLYESGMKKRGADAVVPAIYEKIKSLPSAQPERKPGNWIIYEISPYDGEGCKCSECGFEGVPYWDFCPSCGADMRGEG